LPDRNNTYITDTESKQQEQHIINHILVNNQYDPATVPKLRSRKQNTELNTQPQRWAKFTYTGKETRCITKLFKKSDMRIAFTTRNNIRYLLQNIHEDKTQNPHNKSGVYQLTWSECKNRYIGQTGSPFRIQYKEHALEFKHGTNKSNYAKHLLDNRHPLRAIDECMEIIHTTVKGTMNNTLEKFYIYREKVIDNQLNDKIPQ
jgi:hypothetical protein